MVIYRTKLLPNAKKTGEIWRDEAHKEGIGDIFLARVEITESITPKTIGFDAGVGFAPGWKNMGKMKEMDCW